MRLKDKVILVTGSTTGIGEGMVRRFAEEGARVMIHGTRADAAKKVHNSLVEQDFHRHVGFALGPLDDPAVPARLVAETVARFGRIDAVVNNAAVMTRGELDSTDLAAFDRTLAINLRAPFLLAQAALPHFRSQGGGRILNIGSVNGYCGEKNQLAYAMSKGGLTTMTRNLADALGAEGIRVNQFNVGWTLTPNEYELKRKEGLPEDWPSRVPRAFAPSGRLLSPDDVAWAAVYFLSDEAALLNGAVLDIEQYPLIGRNPPKSA
ncbi:MAG TPA: SDR family oxidoreductase [Candidatus Methylacidiphilales bacterium]